MELDGDPFPELNNLKWPIVDGGEEIGTVTSAIYSPRLERNIGFAWLPVERSTLGERVTVETEWGATDGDRRRDAVRRPEQADPGLLGPPART